MDEERAVVKTYVPQYQKDEWTSHAADLNMSQSEFVRAMVQAGRRGFDAGVEETGPDRPDPGGSDLETAVLDALANGPRSWADLRSETRDVFESWFEERLESTLADLQSAGRVRYSGPEGGYVRDE